MLSYDEIAQIKQLSAKGYSDTEISRMLKYSRTTVSKYLNMKSIQVKSPFPRKRSNTKGARLEPYIKDYVLANQSRNRKDRLTARDIYVELKANDFYGVGELTERSVIRLVKKVKDELRFDTTKIKLESVREPGDAEIDFGEVHIRLNLVEVALHYLVLVFPFSNMRFACLLPAQNYECLAYGLNYLFSSKAINGVPRRLRLDNMSTAVSRVISKSNPAALGEKVFIDSNSKERVLNTNFAAMAAHFGFELEFCNPASGNEKGCVENAVGWFRHQFFNHLKNFDGNYEAINEKLLAFSDKRAQVKHYKATSEKDTIHSRFQQDKMVLLPLPEEPFDCDSWSPATVNNYGRVVVDGNEYAAGGAYPRNKVFVRKFWNMIKICTSSGEVLNSFPRVYSTGHKFIDWDIEFNLLIDRPVGFRNSNLALSMPANCKAYIGGLSMDDRRAVFKAMQDRLENNDITMVVHILEACLNEAKGVHLSGNNMACEIRGHNEKPPSVSPSSLKGLPASWAVSPKIEVSDKYAPADDKSAGES